MDLGSLVTQSSFFSDSWIGGAIFLIISSLFVGQRPDFAYADCILPLVKALSHALWNIGQKNLLDIETYPTLSDINCLSSHEYAVDRGSKRPTSKGCNRCVVCGGRIRIIMPFLSALLIKAILTWLKWPSTIRRRFWVVPTGLVYRRKTCRSHKRPMALLLYPLLKVVKCALESTVTSSTHVSWMSPDSPLYTRRGGIHFPTTKIQARILINSRLLSCFDLVTRPDFKAYIVITRFNDLPKPIRNPFLSKLYMFLAVIWCFLITRAS